MAVNDRYVIDMVPKATPVVVKLSQYDSGREIIFDVKKNGTTFSLAGYSAAVVVKTRSTKVATMMCTINGASVKFSSTPASTLYSGRHMGELRITKTSGEYVGSCNFIWEVEASPESDFIPSEDEENTFADMFQSAMQAAGQAQSYLQQMRDLLGNAEVAIENIGKRRYVFIGDSYGSGLGLSDPEANNWITRCAETTLKIPAGEYYKSAVDGAGFCKGTTFKTQFESLNIDDPLTITDVVVCGGWNDGNVENLTIRTAMKEFVTSVKSRCPNATVHIGMISWADSYRRKVVAGDDGSPTWNCRNALDAYRWAGAAGAAFIGNAQYIMHNMDYFQNDGLHPNDSGNWVIGEHIATYLMGGDINIFRYSKVGFTKDGGITSSVPDMYSFIDNGQVGLVMASDDGLHIDFSSRSIKTNGFMSGNNAITVGEFANDHVAFRGGNFSELAWYGPAWVRRGSTWENHTAMMRLGSKERSRKLEVAIFETNGSNFPTLTDVNAIWIPEPWCWLRAPSMMC